MTAPLPIRFGPQTCTSLDAAAAREWLVADGLGGYAMGTVCGLRTRRYHGLLVVADGIPARRHLGLVSLDPVLVLPSGARVRLAVHEWADHNIAPTGHELLVHFDLDDGLPRWRWRVGDVVLERELAMQHGRSSLAVTHRLISGGPVRVELEALVTWRDVHGERGAWADPPAVEHGADGAVVDGAFRIAGPGWQPAGEWYRGVHARAEAERGLNADEDVWFAGRFTAELSAPGALVEVSAWAGDLGTVPRPAAGVVRDARSRAADVLRRAGAQDAVDARLVLGADAFVTTGPDVVAGYPWFGSWSRDTMTSYEGLFLETGRADEGRQLLTAYAATLSEGMLANTADTGSTEYNTADATLWFLHAVDRHVVRTGDRDLGTELLPGIDGVIKAHVAGTRYGIRVGDDGLLTQGEPGYALTWMDARIDGIGVTPRAGKPVEINALWIHGLAAAGRLRRTARQATGDLDELIRTARETFRRRFPSPGGGLYDVIDGPDGADPSVRPNQLLALGLPDAPVSDRSVLTAVAGLLTPLGLRSLDPTDPAYRPRHRGGPRERDAAYHQGTVWPWLVGPYTDAARTVGADPTALVEGLVGHLSEAGLGSVSETADAGPPHGPTGCPFQAWSVAELLRARRTLTSGPREEAG